MAGVHPQNVIFMPTPLSPSSEGRGHRLSPSSGSTTSGITASDTISGRQCGSSMSNSQLLGNSRHHPVTSVSSIRYSYTQRESKWTCKTRARTMRVWRYARFVLTVAVLSWVVYCTIRYFIAVRIYRGDHVRSRYALGMGVASAFTIIFFACKTLIVPWFSNSHHGRLSFIIHSLAYLSSALVLGLTIINLVLVNVWRTPRDPAQFARSIQGRCHWDLDVVWSGTGMACAQGNAKPFGDWLGAGIVRLVMSVVLITAYHLLVDGFPADRDVHQASPAADASMGELGDRRPATVARPHVQDPLLVQAAITASEDELQRRSLSFTVAGQVLSRVEGSEFDEMDDHASSTSSSEWSQRADEAVASRRSSSDYHSLPPPRTDSPETLSPAESAGSPSNISPYLPQTSLDPDTESGEPTPNRRPSSYLRIITTPSNDLQDFASAFQALASNFTQETEEGMILDRSPRPMPRPTVRVLGSYISRMSTIDSMASREAGSPVRSQTGSDTNVSHGSGSESRNRDPTLCSDRDRDEELQPASPAGTGSSEGPSP
ncbi:hypothetical protein JB92DRAFT_3143665 [Gautieria morchelliformis]|nr:hypothetical protein JB92DRAFT_3143665 [Gautieria morchelliformis]